jgi:1-deoxy-D-xylulose-5-phosphate synthase
LTFCCWSLPVLDQISSPDDVKALAHEDLPVLAQEIREFIIKAVSEVGGHLGSNLGAVELTLALHRVFDSPRDVLLWDTGHQAYVHKLVTGRRDGFGQLRQAGGLSGYPSRAESPHDWIENSHASTALSWAYGLARGFQGNQAHEDRHVVAVVGDGALTGGMAYEALNNIGHSGLPVTIILNDNGRSYAETISKLSEQVSDLRMDPRYRKMRAQFDALLERIPMAERVAGAGLKAVKSLVSDAPALQAFVEALGVRYLGPFDGHDVPHLERALELAANSGGPVLVHVLTEKGKGYEPAEADPEKKLHDTSAFDVATGLAPKKRGASWTGVFSEALTELAGQDPRIIAMTAAMPGSTGLLPVQQQNDDQMVDVGIAEQHAVTAAAGMAKAGRIPVFAVYSTFFCRAFDQATFDVGLHNEHVVFVFDRAGVTGPDGASHHGVLDMALTLRIPTMTVLAPANIEDLPVMLGTAVHDVQGPVAIRFPRTAAVSMDIGAGKGLTSRQVREGADVVIVSVGDRLEAALAAADVLAAEGVQAGVWDARCVKPVDTALLDGIKDAPLIVTVENGFVHGGAGSFIVDKLTDRVGVRHVPAVLRLGVPDTYLDHGTPERILAELGLDADGIAAATRKALADDR